jgi:hypothetical protein
MSCRIHVPGAGHSESFPFERGGRQGGMETPEVFNIMIECLLEPLVASWRERRLRFVFDPEHPPFSHIVWADNIILLAGSTEDFATMAQELTAAIYGVGFRWKPASLECMMCGSLEDCEPAPIPEVFAEHPMTFAVVQHMVVLGILLGNRGDTAVSMEHRLLRGEACFWRHWEALSGPAPVSSKLNAWSAAPSAAVTHGSCTWHLSKHILMRLQRWEWNLLGKIFQFKRWPDEGCVLFNKRTSQHIRRWLSQTGRRPICYKVLLAVFKHAWRERTYEAQCRKNYLAVCREYRNRAWWDGIKDLLHLRAAEGLVHAG